MKTKQINKMKVMVFEEKELKERYQLTPQQVKLILDYQEKFPELIQKQKPNEFLVDARRLWEQLNEPQGEFNKFAKRDIVDLVFKENGKNTKENKYKEFKDYIIIYKYPKGFDETKVVDVKELNKNQLSRYGITTEYKLTVNCAKKISMQQGNKIGDIIQDYFILMEDMVRNNDNWIFTREDEKKGWNKMRSHVFDWCVRMGFDETEESMYTREANLLNLNLLGMNASEINWTLKNNDRLTRNHLYESINKALTFLQELNCSLLINNYSFKERSKIIEATCKYTYPTMKEDFINNIRQHSSTIK